ncbi:MULTISPECIES: methyl-accepting chemotaxis protein [unclassified Thermosynechococcus]|uniref:methyl-accepting chemotaxis protein n=1 Tax=unclassified Thermosynechococcus TaxID=2622553 RepID=UPI002877C602|nr:MULTISPECIES: methyl-accepting chemotaxis protein [unclassified Thermosynechococcus]WNC52709.1 methyl-accepting chemotaxis protein [Thermosynechococcus sp. TG215]WNC57797.1 methyl-accepting chemotaxis protein [Thermosynechococcus sp. TG218]
MTTAKPSLDIPPLPPSVLNYQLPPLEEKKATTNGKSPEQPLPPPSPRRRGWGLRPKFITHAVVLATLPMVGVGFVANQLVRQQFIEQVISLEQQEVGDAARALNEYLQDRQGDARLISLFLNRHYTAELQQRNRRKLEGVLNEFVENSARFDSAAIIANDGQGTVIAQSAAGNQLANNILQNHEYFKLAIQTRGLVLTLEPTLSLPAPSRPFGLFLAMPLINPQNQQITAVLRLRVPKSSLKEALRDYQHNQYENFYLIGSQGKIVAASIPELQRRPLAEVFPQLSQQWETNLAVGTLVEQRRSDGKFQFASYARANHPFTAVVLDTDRDYALRPLRNLTWTLLLGVGVTAIVVAAIAIYASDREIQPLLRATKAVSKIGEGDLQTRLPVEGDDELATLNRTINQMAERLEQSLTEAQQAAQRAQQLRDSIFHLTQQSDRQQILDNLVNEGRHLLGCDRVIFYEFDENYVGKVVAESVAVGWPQALEQVIDDPCFRQNWVDAYTKGRVQATADILNAGLTDCHLKQLAPLKVRANLVVPVLVEKKLAALLIAHQCSEPRQWQQPEIDAFLQLANQAGLVLERSKFLEQTTAAQKEAERLAQEQQQRTERIQMQLINLLTEVEAASQGDLTVRADITADEIGTVADIFNSLIESLRDVVVQVKATTEKVNTALLADETAMTELAEESLRQAKKVKRMLDAVEAMSSSIESVANSANEAAAVARKASERAVISGETMDATVDSILYLRETVAETAKKVKRLGESSQQISKVISLINQIALQTNLLAINASIEAARAGEEGRGFAVVAEEVGELAARSAAATREIEHIVETIQQETHEVVSAMETGTAQVVEGTRLVEVTKQNLQEIVQVSQHIDELVQSISQATVSQARTANTVNTLMRDFAKVSEGMSATSKEISESLQATVDMAQELQNSVNIFKVTAEG